MLEPWTLSFLILAPAFAASAAKATAECSPGPCATQETAISAL